MDPGDESLPSEESLDQPDRSAGIDPPPTGDEAPSPAAELRKAINPYTPPEVVVITDGKEEQKGGEIRQSPQPHIGWAVLLTVGLMFAQVVTTAGATFGFITFSLASGGSPRDFDPLPAEFMALLLPVATLTTLLAALVFAGLVLRSQVGRRLAMRNFSPIHWPIVLALVVPLSVVAGEVSNCANAVLHQFDTSWLRILDNSALFEQFARLPWPLVFVGACLLPGLGEEIFFRGLLSRGLIARHGLVWGTFFASLLFGLIHLAPAQVAATLVMGVVIQVVFLTTRSLLAPIVLHTLNNSLAFVVMRYNESVPIPGYTVEDAPGASHVPLPMLLAAVLASGLLLGLLVQTRTRWMLPDEQEWSPGYFTTEIPQPELNALATSRTPNLALAALALVSLAGFAVATYYAVGQS